MTRCPWCHDAYDGFYWHDEVDALNFDGRTTYCKSGLGVWVHGDVSAVTTD